MATRFTVPATSAEVRSPSETVGAASSSVIVIVAVLLDKPALLGDESVTMKVSLFSSTESDKIGIVNVCVKSPGLNVRLPDVEV